VGLSPIEQEVLKKWKSTKRLYAFLERELKRINRECFAGHLSLPSLQLLRMKYSYDLLGEGFVGAYYVPPQDDRPAQIGIYPWVLTSEADARLALAHELVHHWEWQHREHGPGLLSPRPVHFLVRRQFSSPEKQYHWQLAHSFRFLAKAAEVARSLGIPMQDFLFKKLRISAECRRL